MTSTSTILTIPTPTQPTDGRELAITHTYADGTPLTGTREPTISSGCRAG